MTDDRSTNLMLISAQKAHKAFRELGMKTGVARSQGVKVMARAMENAFDEILEANTLDLEMSREMAVPDLILKWLKLTPERLEIAVDILKQIADSSDPIERITNAFYQLNPSRTYCQRMPLGVIALVYEAFPELGAITAGFCLKTGNSLILHGSGFSSHSNEVITNILKTALEDSDLPEGCVEILSSDRGTSIEELVTQDQYINLVIPYGRPSLISQVSQLATAPVLKSAMGNCYLYWSPSADLDLVRWVILDSHGSIPDPINAIEKVLISSSQTTSFLLRLFNSLKDKGFELRGDLALSTEFSEHLNPVMNDLEWSTPYLDKIIAFKVVDDLEEAITWINHYSSGHADCLVTESYKESRQFAKEIDSALIYINSSPRFSRNPKQGESVFLGISNQKGHRRGLIGLDTLTTTKQVVQG
ncbi:Glutamate-5-semialdehyde dehydrogenase [Gloeothece citriformis PCC 7424]|uniref:Gamma-glutamyl phosphate reductase n=1 Tax=Gloeothece citriformis (strain PCC 7424) TaxID=65393 RepID=B7KDW5_GLOC7|nr:glutamate-5-semialdehyde dehydrogenase [Gloeothece citriformis]ACK71663.1 Glutamate-5-semialdehyde dehydrogenase [Gloeothece citriformis PCC 7424]